MLAGSGLLSRSLIRMTPGDNLLFVALLRQQIHHRLELTTNNNHRQSSAWVCQILVLQKMEYVPTLLFLGRLPWISFFRYLPWTFSLCQPVPCSTHCCYWQSFIFGGPIVNSISKSDKRMEVDLVKSLHSKMPRNIVLNRKRRNEKWCCEARPTTAAIPAA